VCRGGIDRGAEDHRSRTRQRVLDARVLDARVFKMPELKMTAQNSDPIVKVSALNFSFESDELRRQILDNIDLEIARGEIVLLEGPSGSGKTTLLTLLSGLRTFHDGSIKLFGNEIRGLGQHELVLLRRRIGYIFQHHNLLDFLSARRNVEIMFQLHPQIDSSEAHARTEEILTAMGLADHFDASPGKLSGGQKQRDLILADEPTAALDKATGRQVVELLQQLSRSKSIPILMVTHDSRILDIADRIIRIEDGRLVDATT
jgi:putative ABC transport system ATP-binding protein